MCSWMLTNRVVGLRSVHVPLLVVGEWVKGLWGGGASGLKGGGGGRAAHRRYKKAPDNTMGLLVHVIVLWGALVGRTRNAALGSEVALKVEQRFILMKMVFDMFDVVCR